MVEMSNSNYHRQRIKEEVSSMKQLLYRIEEEVNNTKY
jgi:hypothetical protein